MDLTEQAGYALASWSRFEGAVTDELTRAITSSFALVACADGDVAAEELEEFHHTLSDYQSHLPALDMAQVQRLFRDLSGAMLSDPLRGRTKALANISAVKDSAESAELVRSAAEIAIAADHRTKVSETNALQEICDCLGVKPR